MLLSSQWISTQLGTSHSVFWTPASLGPFSQVLPKFSLAIWYVPKHVMSTPMVLQDLLSDSQVTLTASWNAFQASDSLLTLMHVSLHSAYSHTTVEAPTDTITLCWCNRAMQLLSTHQICLLYSDRFLSSKYLITGLSEFKVLAHQVSAMWFNVRWQAGV